MSKESKRAAVFADPAAHNVVSVKVSRHWYDGRANKIPPFYATEISVVNEDGQESVVKLYHHEVFRFEFGEGFSDDRPIDDVIKDHQNLGETT